MRSARSGTLIEGERQGKSGFELLVRPGLEIIPRLLGRSYACGSFTKTYRLRDHTLYD